MDRKKIVIVSRTIYPSPFPRAVRASELAKEFARQGHDVTLYAALTPFDYTAYEKEHQVKIRDIGRLIFSSSSGDVRASRNIVSRGIRKILKKLIEFPDIDLMFKMPSLFKSEPNIDLLISIAVPYPIHWGCALAKSLNPKSFPKTWVADCGDPYMGNRVTDSPPFFYFKYLEKWFCRKADFISVPVAGAIEGYYPEFRDKIVVIPQGVRFPPVDSGATRSNNPVPTFAYAGTFYKGFRDPSAFLEYLTTVKADFRCIFFVPSSELLSPYFEKLDGKIEIRPFIPREQLLDTLRQMDFLLHFDNGTSVQSPSKLIDYVIVNRPVLAIGQGPLPIDSIQEFFRGDYKNQYKIDNPDQYRIENVGGKFLSLIGE